MDRQGALALLEWQIELGALDAIGDRPVDRFALGKAQAAPAPPVAPILGSGVSASDEPADPVSVAARMAAEAKDLDALRLAMTAFDGCELKKGARSMVFADGVAGARVMIVGEAPGRDEDIQGKPFVGRAGQLLDAMFGAIGLSRVADEPQNALYITNVLPWRPPENRTPSKDEIAMFRPFLERHIELADPEVIVAMGNPSCFAILGREGITRLRGTWQEAFGRPVLPMFHPAYLLRTSAAKREAWADLLSLKARMRELA